MYLKSSDPDFDSYEIVAAFEALYDTEGCPVDVFFEHGQWWVRTTNVEAIDDDDVEHTYSVVDAEGPERLVCNGLSFEEV